MFYIFYAGLLYSEEPVFSKTWLLDLPDGAYVYFTKHKEWYRKDLTPVLLEDVPKELRLQILLLT